MERDEELRASILAQIFDRGADPHVVAWLERAKGRLGEKNPNFTPQDLVHFVSEKIIIHDDGYVEIDDEEISILKNGKVNAMAPDLIDLPEFDWDAPDVQEWVAEQEERFKEKFGRITHEELFQLEEMAQEVLKAQPNLRFHEAVDIVWKRALADGSMKKRA